MRDCLNTSLASTEPRPLVRKSPHISERVLGHAIKGVEGTYDRHEYAEEKAEALKQLDHLIETIINPSRGNVVVVYSGLMARSGDHFTLTPFGRGLLKYIIDRHLPTNKGL